MTNFFRIINNNVRFTLGRVCTVCPRSLDSCYVVN